MKKLVLMILCVIFLLGNAMAESTVTYNNSDGSKTTVIYGPSDSSGNREVDIIRTPSTRERINRTADLASKIYTPSSDPSTDMAKAIGALWLAGMCTEPLTTLTLTAVATGGLLLWKIGEGIYKSVNSEK